MNKSLRLFYTEAKPNNEKLITIIGEEAHHIREVLRMKLGEKCRIANSKGDEYFSKIANITKERIVLKVIKEHFCQQFNSCNRASHFPIAGDYPSYYKCV